MNILFICGCLEPGKDGVGDYTRLLAKATQPEHDAHIIALNDTCTSTVSEQGQDGVATTRIPSQFTWRQKANAAKAIVKHLKPDIVSLQFVSYSYAKHGIVRGFARRIKAMIGQRPLHIMFHEIWIGAHGNAPLKDRIIGTIQRFFIKRMIRRLKPVCIHTHAQPFMERLQCIFPATKQLPLFANIQPTDTEKAWAIALLKQRLENRSRNECLLFGIFGNAPPQWDANLNIQKIKDAAKQLKKHTAIVFFGKNNISLERWTQMLVLGDEHTNNHQARPIPG